MTLRSAFRGLLEGIVIALMVALALLVITAVLFRKGGASLVWYDEVASILLAWLTYFGAALAALHKAHIGFPGLVKRLGRRGQLVALAVREVIVLGFLIVLAWAGCEVVAVLQGTSLVSLPWISARLTHAVIPVGAALFILSEVLILPDLVRRTLEAGNGGPP